MKIKQSRSTKLANELLAALESDNRDFSDAVVRIIKNEKSYFSDGYSIYGNANQRQVNFYGHMNFDKVLLEFMDFHRKSVEVTNLRLATQLIVSYLYMDDSDEILNKILKSQETLKYLEKEK